MRLGIRILNMYVLRKRWCS